MAVQDSINVWGREKFAKAHIDVPEGTHISLDEDLPSSDYCETCGPDPVTVTISGGGETYTVYMSVGEIIQEILAAEAAGL